MPTPTLLISKSDFAGHIDLSANLNASKKLNQHILHAQDFDLLPLLGENFYYDMLSKIEDEPYKTLLNGGIYTNKQGIAVSFEGLKIVLVYFSGARLVKELDLHITPNAIMGKRNEFSDPIELKNKTYTANQYENTAIAYFNKIVRYLDFKSSDFPYWKTKCCDKDNTGFRPRIKAVGYGR